MNKFDMPPGNSLPGAQVHVCHPVTALRNIRGVIPEQIMTLRERREKHYISSSHLGLIRCLTPFRVRISTIASI